MTEQEKTVRSTCPYCGVGCGVIGAINDAGQVSITGDSKHPANYGRLCSKGTALADTLNLKGRLLYPEIDSQQVTWVQAIAAVSTGLQHVITEHGPDSVAFYVSGQLLTEDYYVANKLMKGFIGSANIDTNSRLCMSSAVAGYQRAFGEDCVPTCYDDLERAKLIVITGSNLAWCHPVLYQRMVRARQLNPDLKVVVIDPRRTQTTGIADLHLQLKAGSDAVLFNGLLVAIAEQQEMNHAFVSQWTSGAEQALYAARQSSPSAARVAEQCELTEQQVEQFYRLFSRTERVVTLFSQGINQSSSGTDKVNSIINCHLLSGRIGRPGMGPFSITGQPNAMGGREVGGLANQLAAHLSLDNAQHRNMVEQFWKAPRMAERPGYKAVDLFDRVADGTIKAIWIMATNPVVSMPEADKVKQALQQCELVIVSDCTRDTDTTKLANIRLPALAWGERDGTVTNSERRISRQRAFLPAPGQARADWWIISQVASQMGFAEQFDYQNVYSIFNEHATLSGLENDQNRLFNISALANIGSDEYDALEPIQWPITTSSLTGTQRLFGDGQFFTNDRKAQLISVTPHQPLSQASHKYPFVLNTGRVRDHWHTMTRTGKSPRLSSHLHEPFVDIHPTDADRVAIEEHQIVRIQSELGNIDVRAHLSPNQKPGEVFVPIHWNRQFSSNARVDSLIKSSPDPVSGQPEFKHSVVVIEPVAYQWYGFVLSRQNNIQPEYAEYWNKSLGKGVWRCELAGNRKPESWGTHIRKKIEMHSRHLTTWIEFFDDVNQHYRAACFKQDVLHTCVFIGPDRALPPRDWLISLFEKPSLTDEERNRLLTGAVPAEQDTGPILCSCFQVGRQQIQDAIETQGLQTPEQIGACLKAGTNCGSCIPELSAMLNDSCVEV